MHAHCNSNLEQSATVPVTNLEHCIFEHHIKTVLAGVSMDSGWFFVYLLIISQLFSAVLFHLCCKQLVTFCQWYLYDDDYEHD